MRTRRNIALAAVAAARPRSRGGELTLIFDKLVSDDGRSAAAPATVTGLVEGSLPEGSQLLVKFDQQVEVTWDWAPSEQ